jgi:ABC-2 type transport system permease protein
MNNLMSIARKEFADLMGNRIVLFIIISFLIYLVFWTYDFYNVLNNGIPGTEVRFGDNLGIAADNYIFFLLCWFGSILGIIIGCSTISSERVRHALNTLMTKPVYRDTIINGKIIGSLVFLATIMLLVIVIGTSIILILCGSSVAPYIFDYISRLPFIFIYAMAFVMVFLSMSMLFSLLIKDQAFAMILSTIMVYVSYKYTTTVYNNLNNIFPGNGITGVLASLSPYSMMWQGGVQEHFMNTSLGAYDAFLTILPDFFKLLLITIVIMSINYIIFVRKDLT